MHTKVRSKNLKRRENLLGRWEETIKTDLKKMGWEGVNWTHQAQDKEQWPVLVDLWVL
jgi:hypothetical protein